ncbi:FAD-dependent oxidoreductase [Microbacterium binotii]|uniref:FAD dependent oxidoreductase domain-containing protein n=1 Tax=Microbacterium binotii TaxID=462710 RepID=A0ABP6BGI2_9MICO
MNDTYDLVIVGGGFFGLRIALYAREELGFDRVAVLEREPETMSRASYVNQARIHNGYHYPRSILTAYRSRVSSAEWAAEYADAVERDFTHYYAIARKLSKVTARQFEVFAERIGAPLAPVADAAISRAFSPLIERAWEAQEWAFDARKLRTSMLARLAAAGGVDVRVGESAERMVRVDGGIRVESSRATLSAKHVVSSVYSQINPLHRASGLSAVPLQLELTEMALVRLPERFRRSAFTVMDGPFFSIMPFPSRGLHTLSHVRYTPHQRWSDTAEAPDERRVPSAAQLREGATTFREMIADVRRYIPELGATEYVDSIREVKAVLANQDRTDSRPILVRTEQSLPGYVCIMGGKIDNVNDVLLELAPLLAPGSSPHGDRSHVTS